MHKLNIYSRLRHLPAVFVLSGFISILLMISVPPNPVAAQNQNRQAENAPSTEARNNAEDIILPARLGESWRAVSPAQSLNSNQWIVLPDADVYTEYGLRKLTTRIYSDGKSRVTIEVFEMTFASGAFGLFTFNHASLAPNREEFFLGRYLVSLAGDRSDRPADPLLIDDLKKKLANESGELPVLPSHLPEQNKIAETVKYLVGPKALAQLKDFSHLKEIIDFTGGVEVATAEYQNGGGKMNLIIVEYQTPQSATAGYTSASKHFESLSQNEKDKSVLKRIGNYLVKAVNISDRPEAEKIINQIKYTPKVYWSGRKLGDVPLDFRPPDPAGVEEATKTVYVLVRSFYWIGFMLTSTILLGLLAGGSYFYWKRHRRRKLGLDDLFSDTGDTVRLNLDDYLLQPDSSIKQLTDGKK